MHHCTYNASDCEHDALIQLTSTFAMLPSVLETQLRFAAATSVTPTLPRARRASAAAPPRARPRPPRRSASARRAARRTRDAEQRVRLPRRRRSVERGGLHPGLDLRALELLAHDVQHRLLGLLLEPGLGRRTFHFLALHWWKSHESDLEMGKSGGGGFSGNGSSGSSSPGGAAFTNGLVGGDSSGDGGFGGSENVYGDGNAKNPSKTYQKKTTKRKPREENTVFKTSGFKSEDNDTAEASPFGRFAANLLISDDILEKDFSRFYSLDSWWEDRLTKLPDEIKRTFPFLAVPKPSKSEKNNGLDRFEKQEKIFNGQSDKPSTDMKGVEQKFTTQPSANNHPTVKPTTLMSYLITLGSRKGDVVLDPFAGSGTTGISCVFSERNYLLIEREKEYFKILKARIKKAENPAGIVQHEWF